MKTIESKLLLIGGIVIVAVLVIALFNSHDDNSQYWEEDHPYTDYP